MIISKSRNNAATDNGYWEARHSNLTGPNWSLYLNSTAAQFDLSSNGVMAAPTSTVFGVNNSNGIGLNGATYVSYCFAEVPGYSKISSYVGNGSTDGPFVHCGFRPKFILIKRADSVGSWFIYDTVRGPYNPDLAELYPNLSNAEANSTTGIDVLASGFKIRSTDSNTNTSGATMVFSAFAEAPIQYANAR